MSILLCEEEEDCLLFRVDKSGGGVEGILGVEEGMRGVLVGTLGVGVVGSLGAGAGAGMVGFCGLETL